MTRFGVDTARQTESRIADHEGKLSLVVAAACIVVWSVMMHRFRDGDVYSVLGPYSIAVASLSMLLLRKPLAWYVPDARSAALGVVVGVSMTALTYPAFALGVSFVPGVEGEVDSLYSAAGHQNRFEALAWLLVIIAAEEFLWRGMVLDALDRHLAPALSNAISIGSYAAVQLGTGSWVLVLMAIVCGTIWTLQRRATRSIVSPFVAHLIWTPVIIVLVPVV